MDKTLEAYLKKLGIKCKVIQHKAVFTVEESKSIKKDISGMHTKSLFLKDEKGGFYLVCMYADNRLDLKSLRKWLNIKKLQFGSKEELSSHLNLTPGSVSIFGMIYAKDVFLILDKKVWGAKEVGFHPNINTATILLSHNDLEKFYNSLPCEKKIAEL